MRADTGQPLRRVQIRVDEWSTGDVRVPAATLTDDEGRYELSGLPAGRFQLKAVRAGFVELAYGQRRPFERGRPIELRDGEVLEHVDFALSLGAVITGRVLDEAGEPVAGASIALARYRYLDGARRLMHEHGDSSDDRGEFRVFGVPPGEHFIVATYGEPTLATVDRIRYVPTYYPDTAAAETAQRVSVALGQEIAGIDITLQRARTATVSGVLRSADGTPLPPFAFVSANAAGETPAMGSSVTGIAGSDGSFSLAGLLPGSYVLEARSTADGIAATGDVQVSDADVTGIVLALSKGANARGVVRFQTGTPPPDLQPSQVFLIVAPLGRQSMAGMSGPPRPRDDWSFELTGLRGRGFIRAGTFGTWQLKSVLVGGRDVTDTPLDFRDDIDGIEVVLTNRISSITGAVADSRGDTAVDATVVVFAADAGQWGPQSRFISSARPDQQGRFTIRGLPPARYLAVAVEYLEPGEEHDPELLDSWRRHSTAFTLAEGESRTLNLTLAP